MTTILGLDPGMAHCGVALVELLPEGERVLDLDVLSTKGSPKKLNALAAEDNVRRVRDLYEAIAGYATKASAIAAERFSAPRNASAAAKVAMVWGAIVAIATERGIPIIQPSPQEVKLAACGARSASKEAVAEAMRARFFTSDAWDVEASFNARVARGQHEHAYDALAVVVASLQSDVVRALRQLSTRST